MLTFKQFAVFEEARTTKVTSSHFSSLIADDTTVF